MAYKVLDDPLLLTIVTEPYVLVIKTCGDTKASKNKMNKMKDEKYIIVSMVFSNINNQKIYFYKYVPGEKFQKVIDYYEKKL